MAKTEVCCELSAMLRPKTYPFGVKFYDNTSERPQGTMRPRYPMNTCQITAIVRYYGRQMYFTAAQEDEVTGASPYGLYDEILDGMKETAEVAAYPTPFDLGFRQISDYTLTTWTGEDRRNHLIGG